MVECGSSPDVVPGPLGELISDRAPVAVTVTGLHGARVLLLCSVELLGAKRVGFSHPQRGEAVAWSLEEAGWS